MNEKLLVSTNNRGTGLWTTICLAFCAIFGKSSKALNKKQNWLICKNKEKLLAEVDKSSNSTLTDFRVHWIDGLNLSLSATNVTLPCECKHNESETLLVSVNNKGQGLWTSICLFFCAIFGKSSKALNKKQNWLIKKNKDCLSHQIEELGNVLVKDYRVNWMGGLNLSMNATAITLPSECKHDKKEELLIAVNNRGTGLWTTICLAFCAIFGKSSKALRRKQDKLELVVKTDLEKQFEALGEEYMLVDFRLNWIGFLNVSASALAMKKPEHHCHCHHEENKEADLPLNEPSKEINVSINQTYEHKPEGQSRYSDKQLLSIMRRALQDIMAGNDKNYVVARLNACKDVVLSSYAEVIRCSASKEGAMINAKHFILNFKAAKGLE